MGLLFRYVSREILLTTLLALLALVGLFSFFDFISEMNEVREAGYTSLAALVYVGLNTPVRVYELTPVAILVGGLFAWHRLAAHSEFSVMRVSGVSVWRLMGWMLLLGALIAALVVLLGETVLPQAERAARQLKVRATSGVVAREFQSGLWSKDGDTFVNIRELRPDLSLSDVRLYAFNARFELQSLLYAQSARWQGDHWELREVAQTLAGAERVRTERFAVREWRTAITPQMLTVLMVAPERMSISNLRAYTTHLRHNRQDARRFDMALWHKLAYPLAAPVMLLLTLAFAYQRPRGGSGGRLLLGVVLGMGFYLFSRLLAQVAQISEWPAPLAALLPVSLFAVAALVAVWRMERG